MCDTLVATADATRDGVVIFAKNSDREPNEAQHLVSVPAAAHPAGSRVKCTYIEIPQAPQTHAVVLSKPFWIWGAEMGVNEHGVAIGNEAVFSKVPAGRKKRLIGMDLLRLGLERAKTAEAALDVMTGLLEKYGQGGNCGFSKKFFYHNSFIMADPQEAWLLETVDRHWAARRVSGVCTISNGLTIGSEWDRASPDLVTFAVKKKWCSGRDDFHFSDCYADTLFTKFSDCRHRSARTRHLLEAARGKIDVQKMADILRDHDISNQGQRSPDRGLTGSSVCMHAGFGPVRASQTTGSMISLLHPDTPAHFFTGTAAPCTGIFKPVWVDAGVPDTGPDPRGRFDPESLFWRHERLHRAVLHDYDNRLAAYRGERDAVENEFVVRALAMGHDVPEARGKFSRGCFEEAMGLEEKWLDQIARGAARKRQRPLHKRVWQEFNRQAGMPGDG